MRLFTVRYHTVPPMDSNRSSSIHAAGSAIRKGGVAYRGRWRSGASRRRTWEPSQSSGRSYWEKKVILRWFNTLVNKLVRFLVTGLWLMINKLVTWVMMDDDGEFMFSWWWFLSASCWLMTVYDEIGLADTDGQCWMVIAWPCMANPLIQIFFWRKMSKVEEVSQAF